MELKRLQCHCLDGLGIDGRNHSQMPRSSPPTLPHVRIDSDLSSSVLSGIPLPPTHSLLARKEDVVVLGRGETATPFPPPAFPPSPSLRSYPFPFSLRSKLCRVPPRRKGKVRSLSFSSPCISCPSPSHCCARGAPISACRKQTSEQADGSRRPRTRQGPRAAGAAASSSHGMDEQ